jgi:YgiT-type zinc finger domain-containing protein
MRNVYCPLCGQQIFNTQLDRKILEDSRLKEEQRIAAVECGECGAQLKIIRIDKR